MTDRHLNPVPDPKPPKAADDALEAGLDLREQTPEEVEATLARCAEIAPGDPNQRPPVPIAESLPGWPYGANILAPAGYEYRSDGIGQLLHPPMLDNAGKPIKDDSKQIVRDTKKPPVWTVTRKQLIAIVGRARNLHSGQEVMTVVFRRDNVWREHPIPRACLRDSRSIVKTLAPLGVEVTSEDAKQLVLWLAACESVNLSTIEATTVSSQMGWQDDTLTTFLWGRETIGELAIDYLGADGGGEGLADAFRAKGTLAEWQQAVAPVVDHPHVLLALYVSLCAPLLAILDAPAWVLDLCGPTSRGKTSALHVAASAWGQPDPGRDPSCVRTWDLTVIGSERTCAALGTLPLMLDDTSRARPNDVPTVVYTATQGQGRTRGTPEGTARVGRWKLPMISTGEQPLRSFGTAGGRTARTMTLWGQPWVGGSVGPVVRAVVAGMRANYGHAGPALVRYLVDKRDTWPGLRERYRRARDHWVSYAAGPTAERLAEYCACVEVCVDVVDFAGVVPWGRPDGLVAGLWSTLAAEVHDAHGAEDALAAVYGVALAQRAAYWSRERADGSETTPVAPHGGWLGRWDRGNDWKGIAFLPQVLRRYLEDLGFPFDATVRAWCDRGWVSKEGRNYARNVRFAGLKARLICIDRAALVAQELTL